MGRRRLDESGELMLLIAARVPADHQRRLQALADRADAPFSAAVRDAISRGIAASERAQARRERKS